jgi:beta-galactosidase
MAAMTLTAVESPHDVRTTMDHLVAALNHRGIAVFARVDHGGGARSAQLELADEELLIFGDPRVGTFLMQSDPEIGFELPLRVLIWDAGGQTRIGYRRPTEVAENYAVADQTELLDRMNALLEELVAESTAAA